MAAKPRQQKRRNVLEHFTDLTPSPSSSSSSSVAPTSIRSLAVSTLSDSETLIYVGTVSGNLLLYSLNPDPVKNSTDAVSFIRYVSVTDSPVESILVFSDIEKVLVVSDGFMHFIDLLLLRPVKKIGTLRGVSVVARRFRGSDSESSNLVVGDSSAAASTVGQGFLQKLGGSGGVRSNGGVKKTKEGADLPIDDNCVFAVAVGKRLVLVGLVGRGDGSFDGVSGSLVTMREVQCPHIVKALVWVDDSVIVGTSSGYFLCSCVTGQWNLIFSLPDTASPPRLKLLMKEYKVLMLVDNVGIIVDSLGHPVGGSLVFHGDPDGIGEMRTCVVAVESGNMELYLKNSGYCVQTVSIAGGAIGKCVVADDEDRSGKLVAVATHSKVFQLSEGLTHFEGVHTLLLAQWRYHFLRFVFCW